MSDTRFKRKDKMLVNGKSDSLKTASMIFCFSAGYKLIILLALYIISGRSWDVLLSFGDVPSYLRIARSFPFPYNDPSMLQNSIHYPLYPAIVYLANLLLGNWVLSGCLTNIGISSLSSVLFYLIACKFSRHALSLALLFSCLPPKWVQVSIYPLSEPIFMFFLLLAVLMHLNQKFGLSYFSLSLLIVSRPLGFIFLASFLAYDVLARKHYRHFILAALATIPFTLFHCYLYVIFGEMLLFQHAVKTGTWGGSIFSWPLSGLVTGLIGNELTMTRKLYTTMEFSAYCAVAVAAVKHWRQERFTLFSFIILPYFAFTLFLKGGSHNWWMLCLPRFLFPLAPFGFIYYFRELDGKYFYLLMAAAALLGGTYAVGGHYLHLKYGPYV